MRCQLFISSRPICVLWLHSLWNLILILLHRFLVHKSWLAVTLSLEQELLAPSKSEGMRVVVWSDGSSEELPMFTFILLHRWGWAFLCARCSCHYDIVVTDISEWCYQVLWAQIKLERLVLVVVHALIQINCMSFSELVWIICALLTTTVRLLQTWISEGYAWHVRCGFNNNARLLILRCFVHIYVAVVEVVGSLRATFDNLVRAHIFVFIVDCEFNNFGLFCFSRFDTVCLPRLDLTDILNGLQHNDRWIPGCFWLILIQVKRDYWRFALGARLELAFRLSLIDLVARYTSSFTRWIVKVFWRFS